MLADLDLLLNGHRPFPLAAGDLAGPRWSPHGTPLATAFDGEREFLAIRGPGGVEWRVLRAMREFLAIRGSARVEWRVLRACRRDGAGPVGGGLPGWRAVRS